MPTPVSEIRLFRFGANESEKGTFYLTPDDAAAVLAAWQARGTRITWDYEHAILKPDPTGPVPASANCGLEVREDGLWAVDIVWTETAAELISKEEYLYFSPFFDHDENGHVTNVINVTLTNTPALHNIQRVAASASPPATGVRALPQPIPRASARRTPLGAAAPAEKTNMEKTKEELAAELAGHEAKCKALKEAMDALDAPVAEDEEEGGEADAANAADPDKGVVPPAPPAKEDASAATAALDAIRKATGEHDIEKAIGKVLALGHGDKAVAALSKQVAELQAAQVRDKVVARVARAKAEGRITPAMAVVEQEAVALGMKSEKRMEAFLSALPVLVATRSAKSAPAGAGSGAGSASLTAVERKVAKKLGVDEAEMLKTKNKMAADVRGRLNQEEE